MLLAQPAWLLLLVLLPLIGAGAVAVTRLRRQQWAAFVAPRLRSALLRSSSPLPRWLAIAFLLAASAALITAMARPQGNAGTRTETSIGRNLLVALDLSRSMRVDDVKPDRLAQAKIAIYELMDAMPNDRIGLIGFAGSAHLFAPLTIDHGAIRETVEQIDESWVPLGGSNLTNAIRLAISTLKETGQKNNALIILSDGEKHEPSISEVAQEADRAGVYIFAIGVGTEDGGFVPNPASPTGRMNGPGGKPVLSQLQPETMRKLATETRGRFAIAGSGSPIPALVALAAKDLDAFEMKGRERRIAIEFYQWLVLPAILLLMAAILAATRWRGIQATTTALIATLAALTPLSPPPANASAVSDAQNALANGHHAEAQERYAKLAESSKFPDRAARYRLGEATAAYRARDFKAARSAFSQALLSESPEVAATAHFGLGNTLFQLGWQALTDQPYPTEPSTIPDLDRFDSLVRERLNALLRQPDGGQDEAAAPPALEPLILNWTDAVRHYHSARQLDPANPDLLQNQTTTLTYLRRLLKLLEEERNQTEDSIPEPQPSPSPGNPGEDPNEGENGPKPPDAPQPGDSPEAQPDAPKKPDEKSEQKDDQGNQDQPKEKPENEQESDETKEPGKSPTETPEEAARRILGENADLEKGPLQPGRHRQHNPEKDW